jgi:ribonuclease HII
MRSRKSSRAEQLALLPEPRPADRGAATRPRKGRRQSRSPLLEVGLVAGVDEAGRGPLAGPVVAAAVILDDQQPIAGVADSKALSPRKRERLFDEIRAKALACCIAEASVEEIDRLNILQATLLAMQRAVQGLRLKPALVLVDGNRLPQLSVAARSIVGGDACIAAISAASILAKVHRDRLCAELDLRHPQYGFARHKGYPTQQHLAALRHHGACADHRLSFAPVREVAGKAAGASELPAAIDGAVTGGDEISGGISHPGEPGPDSRPADHG